MRYTVLRKSIFERKSIVLAANMNNTLIFLATFGQISHHNPKWKLCKMKMCYFCVENSSFTPFANFLHEHLWKFTFWRWHFWINSYLRDEICSNIPLLRQKKNIRAKIVQMISWYVNTRLLFLSRVDTIWKCWHHLQFGNIASLPLYICCVEVFMFHKSSDGKFSVGRQNVELSSFAVVLTDGFLFSLDEHAYEIFRLFNAPHTHNVSLAIPTQPNRNDNSQNPSQRYAQTRRKTWMLFSTSTIDSQVNGWHFCTTYRVCTHIRCAANDSWSSFPIFRFICTIIYQYFCQYSYEEKFDYETFFSGIAMSLWQFSGKKSKENHLILLRKPFHCENANLFLKCNQMSIDCWTVFFCAIIWSIYFKWNPSSA